MKDHGLLQDRKTRRAEVYQAAKLFKLLPQGPNDLWQMDVTYIHIPGYGWWYAVTVIDYYSRYLLACHLTASYRCGQDGLRFLKLALEEAERIRWAIGEASVLGDRQWTVVHCAAVHGIHQGSVQPRADPVSDAAAIGPVGTVPRDLEDRRSVLAIIRPSAACSWVPGRVSRSIQRTAASLGIGTGGRRRRARAGRSLLRRPQDPRFRAGRPGPAAQAKLEKMMEDAA